jgi:uncharacterized protein (DUF952 family)
MSTHLPHLLHITAQSDWQEAQQLGEYRAESLKTEGFIHCSTPAQLLWVAHRFYLRQTGLVLLEIDRDRLQARLQFDEIETGERFPHVYGALNLDAVVRVLVFEAGADGLFQLPTELNHSEAFCDR